MAAYILARIHVTDPVQYREYTSRTPPVLAKFKGRLLARGGTVVSLEGPEETRRVVVIEFPTLEMAKGFFASPEYQAAKRHREGAAIAEFIAIAGV
jgi:uncharacterized protein (DUF1330 family)